MNDALLRDIDTFVRENETRIVRDMARLVSVPSVESAPAPGAPFGAGPREALACVLDMAQELGLDTVNCEDKLGYAVIGEDRGQGYLATITHVDIVPTGDGWPADPFVLREQDGYLLGRGIMDDKGPSVLCLYALKYLKDAALALRYPIRALFGSNEETHMADVEHYIEHYPAPLFCFSPDADFPLIHGEKGIYHAVLRSHHSPENVLEISGGIVINAVPDSAAALVRADALESSGRVLVKQREPGLWELSASGVSGHASMPEGTVNAIGVLVEYLLTHDIPSERERPYFDFLSKLHLSPDGSGVGLKSSDGRFTPLTAVGGRISTEGGVISQTVDVRYGTAMSGEKITASLTAAAAGAADVEVLGDSVPFYMGPENPAVQACLASYNQITGEDARSYTIGGGTYARHFPNAVAFGPEHPERPYPDFCGPIHGVNEAARKSDLMEALKIYILALIRLEALDY
ncbi:MAG: Sapep family Mn(2+)-dependent dipeptidase [Oscillospiraceae bacterium]|nr:Sapep family Mn(2+)-dependent dipeptidase [Oscillospiraceae bacterium]